MNLKSISPLTVRILVALFITILMLPFLLKIDENTTSPGAIFDTPNEKSIFQGSGSRGGSEPIYLKEETNFTGVNLFSNTTLIFFRNITVESGAELRFKNCTLLSLDNSIEKTIHVKKNGKLILEEVFLTVANSTEITYSVLENSSFSIESRGYLEIKEVIIKNYRSFNIINSNSFISNLKLQYSQMDGIYFKSSHSTVTTLTISSTALSGLNAALSNLSIENLTIENVTTSSLYLKNTVLNLTGKLQIQAGEVHIDLDDSTTVFTDNMSIKEMSMVFRDKNSKIVIQSGGLVEVLQRPEKESESSNITKIFLFIFVALGILFLAFFWFKTQLFFATEKKKEVKYSGESAEKFKIEKPRETKEPTKEEQIDVLFEFGKMAMNAGNHNKAVDYFNKLMKLCDSEVMSLTEREKKKELYLKWIYERARRDVNILRHYKHLLSPVFKESDQGISLELPEAKPKKRKWKKYRSIGSAFKSALEKK
ncbi:MAG TPA: hypothetical protein EYP29_05700 [Thermoplasmata archaeon]|nr:hypothetical protein [Thermoplasmata archaeon]